jgi:ferredoxin
MRVAADRDLCQGHQLCQAEAPTIFGFDRAEDTVVLLKDDVTDEELPGVRTAVKYCPAMALDLMED